MSRRLESRTAIVVGAGQTLGETIGNGRATSLLFAREGARVLAVDRDLDSALETVEMIEAEGGEAAAFQAAVVEEDQMASAIEECIGRWDRIDVLHNNVGISLAGGDAPTTEIKAEAFDRLVAVNLRGMVFACKHAIPRMRERQSRAMINISLVAARTAYPYVGYKTTKAGVIALTEQLAIAHAGHGVRVNAILPGLMNTPMAIESRVGLDGKTRDEVIAERETRVPLGRRMGSAWDVAHAALFLASDDASFITGVALAVDGGGSLRVG